MSGAALAAALIVTFLPGAAVLAWLAPARRDLAALASDAAGLSLALTALAGLAGFILGGGPGPLGTAFLYGACLATLTAVFFFRSLPRMSRRAWLLLGLQGMGLLVFLGALLALRLYQVRALALPNWVDSVHHTLAVRVIMERGGLPGDLLPYLNAPLSYHYGFHIIAAAFGGWANLPSEQAVLLYGQTLIALISLGLYRLARALGLDWRAAAGAALITGFTLHIPGYYATWGRYTLSAGLVVLLPCMAAALDLLKQPRSPRLGIKLALLTAGVCLTHYLATLLLLFFFALIGLTVLWRTLRTRRLPWLVAAWPLLGGLASLPWLLRMLSDNAGSANIQPMRTVVTQADWNYLLSLLRPDSNKALLAAAAVALLLALRRRELRLFVVWALTLLFFAQPFAPRIGPFRPDLYVILLFIPASIALGALISDSTAALSRRTRPWIGRSALALTILLLLLLGWKENRDIINPITVIATPADLQALQWVRDNTPADARFYINAVAWQGNIYRGMDGGYWIMPFAGRFTSIPPVLYVYMSPDEVAAINRMADQSQKITGCTPDFWQIVSDLNLTHVYVRQATGSLQPAALDECPRLTNIYRDNGIAIYEIQRVR